MKFPAIIALFAISALSAHSAISPTIDCTVGGHKIQVFMEDKPFDAKSHKIEYKRGSYGDQTLYIDGKTPIGSDNQIPLREWKRFTVFWDGKELPINPKLFANYYNPNIDSKLVTDSGYGCLKFIVDPSGKWIQILMFGSDGGGSYLTAWQLSQDGQHKSIDPEVFVFTN